MTDGAGRGKKVAAFWAAVVGGFALTAALLAARALSVADWHGADLSPFYVQLAPRFSAWGLVAVALFAVFIWLWPRAASWRPRFFLPAATLFFAALALALAALYGGPANIPSRAVGVFLGDLNTLGSPASFFGRYHLLLADIGIHGRVRPPGLFLLLWALVRVVGTNGYALQAAWALGAAAAAFPVYFFAARVAGARAAPVAVVLYLLSGCFATHGVSYDGLFATLGIAILYFVVMAAEERGWRGTVAAGVTLAAGALFSFTLAFILVFLVVIFAERAVAEKRAGEMAAKAALVVGIPIATLVLLYFLTGYDWPANFAESYRWAQTQASGGINVFKVLFPRPDLAGYPVPAYRRSYWLWMPGNLVALALTAGVPITVLYLKWLWDLRRREARATALGRVFGLAFLALVLFNLTGVTLGETERVWLYLVPVLAIPAAAALVRLADETAHPRLVAAVFAVLFAQVFVWRVLFWVPW